MSSIRQRKQPPSTCWNIGESGTLLLALQAAHRQVETAFSQMKDIASEDVPDLQRFSAARLRIGQANLARRQIVEKVASHLISVTPADQAEAMREHRRRDQSCFHEASTLVREWTLEEVQRNWNGYFAASEIVRERIRAIIAAEKALLYPLLSVGSSK